MNPPIRFKALNDAYQKVEAIAKKVNEGSKQAERLQKLVDLQDSIKGLPACLCSPSPFPSHWCLPLRVMCCVQS